VLLAHAAFADFSVVVSGCIYWKVRMWDMKKGVKKGQ